MGVVSRFGALGLSCALGFTLAGCQEPFPTVCQFDYRSGEPLSDPVWADVARECNLKAGTGNPDWVGGSSLPFDVTPACQDALRAAIVIDEESFAGEGFDLREKNFHRLVQILFFYPLMRTDGDWIVQAPTVDNMDSAEVSFLDPHFRHFRPFDEGGVHEVREDDVNIEVRNQFCARFRWIGYEDLSDYHAMVKHNRVTLAKDLIGKELDAFGFFFGAGRFYHEMVHGEKNGSHVVCNDGIDDHFAEYAVTKPTKRYCDPDARGTYTRDSGFVVAAAMGGLRSELDGQALVTKSLAKDLAVYACGEVVTRANDLREKYHGKLDCEESAEAVLQF